MLLLAKENTGYKAEDECTYSLPDVCNVLALVDLRGVEKHPKGKELTEVL